MQLNVLICLPLECSNQDSRGDLLHIPFSAHCFPKWRMAYLHYYPEEWVGLLQPAFQLTCKENSIACFTSIYYIKPKLTGCPRISCDAIATCSATLSSKKVTNPKPLCPVFFASYSIHINIMTLCQSCHDYVWKNISTFTEM